MNIFYYSNSYVYLSLKMSIKVNIASKIIPDNHISEVVLENIAEILIELKDDKLNKKRKKDNASGLSSAKKKTKTLHNYNDNEDKSIQTSKEKFECLISKKTQKYFLIDKNIWHNNLNKVKEYIDKNKKRPSYSGKNKEIKQLGSWIGTQQNNYKYKKNIMKDENIYSEWTQFMNEYEKYIKSYENNWYNSLNQVKEYIDKNKKRPSYYNKDKEIKQLGCWINTQQKKYIKKKNIMKDENIYNEWTQFINKYENYFKSHEKNYTNYFKSYEKNWYNSLNQVKEYIDKNKKTPSNYDKNIEIKRLAKWICVQKINYKKEEYNMKEKNIYNEWTQFMNKYEEYNKSYKNNWYNNFNKVKEYIDNNKKRPISTDQDKEIQKLAKWIGTQKINYKKKEYNMKDKNIYNEWTQFMNEYEEYFLNRSQILSLVS